VDRLKGEEPDGEDDPGAERRAPPLAGADTRGELQHAERRERQQRRHDLYPVAREDEEADDRGTVDGDEAGQQADLPASSEARHHTEERERRDGAEPQERKAEHPRVAREKVLVLVVRDLEVVPEEREFARERSRGERRV